MHSIAASDLRFPAFNGLHTRQIAFQGFHQGMPDGLILSHHYDTLIADPDSCDQYECVTVRNERGGYLANDGPGNDPLVVSVVQAKTMIVCARNSQTICFDRSTVQFPPPLMTSALATTWRSLSLQKLALLD